MGGVTSLASTGFRLSPQQEYLWPRLQVAGSGTYGAMCVLTLDGSLEGSPVHAALRRAAARHEILRTVFQRQQGMRLPFQVILGQMDPYWQEIDWSELANDARRAALEDLLREERSAVFDFEQGPLLRAKLARLDSGRHLLLLNLSALCGDGVTLKNLTREIVQDVTGNARDAAVVQYADVGEWLLSRVESDADEGERARDFWRKYRQSAPPAPILPFERRQTEGAGLAVLELNFPDAVCAGLRALAAQCDAKVEDVLLACWGVLLWRFTAQDQPAIDALFSGRDHDDLQNAFGPLSSYVPLAPRFGSGLSFLEIVTRTAAASAEARNFAAWFMPEGDRHGVGFEYSEWEDIGTSNLRVGLHRQFLGTERHKLKLSCILTPASLLTELQYDTSAFPASAAAQLARCFEVLLPAALKMPQVPADSLRLLSETDRSQILYGWNSTASEYPDSRTIHGLFEDQVAKTPARQALVAEDETVTYTALNERANRLAEFLSTLGVGPDIPVGVCLDRSAELMIALLAVLKAGGVFIPLSSEHPSGRLAQQLAGAAVLITQQTFFARVPADFRGRTVYVDRDSHLWQHHSGNNLRTPISPENLAYVLYTSGSTGVPKGVAVRHRNLVNYAHFICRVLELDKHPDGLRFATVSTIAADLGNTCIYPSLISGGCLHLVPQSVAADSRQMADYQRQHAIDVLKIVPSHLEALLNSQEAAAVLPAKYLISGGEALSWALVEKIRAFRAQCRLINHYGPTETTVGALTLLLDQDAGASENGSEFLSATVPIGRPIANAQVYVLDANLEPIPVGVAGELYIGGAGVSSGYLNQPEMTAERFVRDKFGSTPDARLYKTGDLVRYLPDGAIEFLGRNDDQVKIRGFRIELGEIQSAIAAFPGIQQAVVLARDDGFGDNRLVAYIVPTGGLADTEQIRKHLRERLPEPMVPSAIVILDRLPLNANGKVDRHALPAPEAEHRIQRYAAPRTPIEEVVASIWADLLRLERVGREDSFFDLGGHSLLATQVVSRVRQTLDLNLSLSALFENPRLADLAGRIEALQHNGREADFPPIRPVSRAEPLPLSFAQQRLWFLDQLEPGNTSYNLPRVVRLTGPLNYEVLRQSVRAIISRHEVFRTVFRLEKNEPVQVILPDVAFDLPVIDLAALPDENREAKTAAIVTQEVDRPFDLSHGPLLRGCVVRLGDQEHVLVLGTHHIVGDGWSQALFWQELATIYDAGIAGIAPRLPELAVQYADYAAWQRRFLSSENLRRQLAYWKDRLDGAPPSLDLPTDRTRPAVQSSRGSRHSFVLPLSLLDSLRALSRAENVTLFMSLLGAFNILLSRYSGQEDIVLGTTIAGRNQAETERLIGFFINTLVLRSDLSGDPSFGGLLVRTREAAMGAYAHQDLPFEKLVEELNPVRDLSRTPLFQVMLMLQIAPDGKATFNNLRISGFPIPRSTSKFDLSFSLTEVAGGLRTTIEYSTDLFDLATIQRMGRHWQTLLEGVADSPNEAISKIPMLDRAERQLVLEDFNATESSYASETAIVSLYEKQAERTPNAVALASGEQKSTYGELNRRANQLAHYLMRRGVGPDVPVALCLERTSSLLTGILGILKAGGAYVPIDPSYPAERIGHILEGSQAGVIVTTASLAGELPLSAGMQAVCLDSGWNAIAAMPDANPVSLVRPENLAYVLFTSGSTGRPKGVALEHRSASAFIHWAHSVFSPEELAGVLLSTSVCFDLSVFEIFVPLTLGGTVILAENALYLPSLPARDQVTLINTVPSAMAELLRMKAIPSPVRTINLAGEALSEALVRQIYQTTQVEKVYNLYGPTEDTTYSTWTLVRPDEPVTIGRPIANTQAYILDAHRQPVPIGVPGELYLAGAGLARGYYGRPDLTAERFVANPFSSAPGARMYRTGDLCRWRAEGTIEYLGRLDHQVKVRGFRIELGEIEAQIGAYAGIHQAVVLAREDTPGDRRLVAYCVPEDGVDLRPAAVNPAAVNPEALRDFLKQKLPDYMVPAAFVLLPELPLSPNGKVDRKALPAPDYAPEATTGFVAPRNPVEEKLAHLWSELLRIERIGVLDNFFDLGGHSLLATRIIGRMPEIFGARLPLRAFFEGPTIAALAGRIENLRLQGRMNPDPIGRVSRDFPLPLSFAQQRLWFMDQLERDSSLYNMPRILRLRGALDLEILGNCINQIVARHEVLRTTFSIRDGEPVQYIAPILAIPLEVTDLTGNSEKEREPLAQRLASEEASTPFDLSIGPLLRVRVLRLAAEDHVLVLNFHHIVSDGWSTGLVTRELSSLYTAMVAGRQPALPELPVQYADFAVWQRGFLSGEAVTEQLSYWSARLAGAPAHIDLPTDHPRPRVQSYRGSRHRQVLPNSLLDALKTLARREQATLFITLLAGFDILLSRYAGHDDIVVGSPIAGRNRAEIENLIGFFVNTLVLRTDLSGQPSFRELLARVRQTAVEAYAHQDLPFERLVEELNPVRDTSRSPLFQIMMVLQNAPDSSEIRIGDLDVSVFEVPIDTAKFDLTLMLTEKPEGLQAVFEYSTDLFDQTTIKRMAGHWQTLFEGIVADPSQTISRIPLLLPAEMRQIFAWSAGPSPAYPEGPVHRLFETQAKRTPEAIALVSADKHVSYRDLNRQANRIAHSLRRLGIAPGSRVAISLDRSPGMIAGLLAILKAGAAYVPLDRGYPQARLSFMLEDAGVQALLTTADIAALFPAAGVPVLHLDEISTASDGDDDNLTIEVGLDDAAYVVYTSGSTGIPKGVEIPHRGIVRLLFGGGFAQLDSSQTLLQFAPVAFDASTLEIWGPLLHGGRCVLFDGEMAGARELGALLRRENVTTAWLTSSLFNSILDEAPEELASLRQLLVGGEALSVPHIRRALDLLPQTQLINGYGPTESTTFTCTYPIPRNLKEGLASIPIGRPIGNTQVYVLDSHLAPVPAGVAGELYIGGDGLARGYVNRPELTAERFVPNPFSDLPGARLYRTGDLCRWLPDGNLEYLGRLDQQVKIRGFRIELGEVEAALAGYPGVRQVAAVVREDAREDAREDTPVDKRLVAYVVPESDQTLSPVAVNPEALREHLKQKLPEYMVPAAFVLLHELPLTANGKVDRRALPAPEYAATHEYVAPRTPAEEVLAAIWAEVLGLDRVGVFDNFFDLGGHSLLATQIVSRIRDLFRVELPVLAIFEAPAVQTLSKRIEALHYRRQGIEPAPIRKTPRHGTVPLSFAQQRLWFLDQLEPGSPGYNVPRIMRLTGPLDAGALERALRQVVRRHEALRTAFPEKSGRPVQAISSDIRIPFVVTDLTSVPREEQEREARCLSLTEIRAPFSLAAGPLLRAHLLRLGAEDHIFIVTAHHIACDGWSQGLLTQELSALYETCLRGEPSPLPELPIQYADFTIWQQGFLSGDVLTRQIDYWKDQLADAPATLDLPTDRPRPAVQTFDGAVETAVLPKPLVDSMKALGRHERATLFMVFLAGFNILLSRYAAQEDIVAGSPIAGRNRSEIEKLIGFFVNTLVLRTSLAGSPTFRELLARVRENAMGAYAHQDLPFEKLVEELNPVRDMSRSPVFQVTIVLQNTPGAGERMGDLRIVPFDVPSQTCKFDLALGLRETSNGVTAEFEYNTALFDSATIERMARHWKILLEAAVADPDRIVTELPIMDRRESEQTLLGWNATARPYPQELLHRLIERQVEKTPDAPALTSGAQTLTYAELNARANQLAHFLRARGVGSERLVAVCMERSLEMVVALLGALKAGGAYLPLDPEYPPDRLATVLEDAQPAFILMQEALAARLPDSSVPTLSLDAGWDAVTGESAENPAHINQLDDAAYVIYTSGSTGRPKGVVNIHSGIVNRLLWAQETMPLGPDDRFLQKTPYSFDVSVTEFFWPLLAGACIVMAAPGGHKDPEYLVNVIRQHEITTIHFVPSMLQIFLQTDDADRCGSLRRVLCSGEALSPELQERFFAVFGEKLHNLYGPTEAAVDVSYWNCRRQHSSSGVPIGHPVANTQLYILDRYLQPVPAGVPGELHIGGVQVARGYLNRPELTAERFIPNPFSTSPSARLYKTGDLARFRPDGTIDYLGRIDHQVKIRGFRIELGEIESLLSEQPGIADAVVLAREDTPGDKRLVAYVVPGAGKTSDLESLRSVLRQKLPEYMWPAAFVELEALPLSANGKFDRKLLPAPDYSARSSALEFIAPHTPIQRTLAGIWAEVLQVDGVGVEDNFFELGGHSLLATQVASRIRKAFSVEMALRELFAAPTILQLAERIQALQGMEKGPSRGGTIAAVSRDAYRVAKTMVE